MSRFMPFTLTDIGRYVTYHPEKRPSELGRIKAMGNHLVFVVFHCDNHWDRYRDYTAMAVLPTSLAFAHSPGEPL